MINFNRITMFMAGISGVFFMGYTFGLGAGVFTAMVATNFAFIAYMIKNAQEHQLLAKNTGKKTEKKPYFIVSNESR